MGCHCLLQTSKLIAPKSLTFLSAILFFQPPFSCAASIGIKLDFSPESVSPPQPPNHISGHSNFINHTEHNFQSHYCFFPIILKLFCPIKYLGLLHFLCDSVVCLQVLHNVVTLTCLTWTCTVPWHRCPAMASLVQPPLV